MRALFLICAGLLLAGCQTAAEVAAQHDAHCRTYTVHGSTDYANCRNMLMQQAHQRRMMGLAILAASQPPARAPMSCHTVGGITNCF